MRKVKGIGEKPKAENGQQTMDNGIVFYYTLTLTMILGGNLNPNENDNYQKFRG